MNDTTSQNLIHGADVEVPCVHVIKNKVHFENDVEMNAVYCVKLDFYIGCRSEHQHERDSAFYSKVKS